MAEFRRDSETTVCGLPLSARPAVTPLPLAELDGRGHDSGFRKPPQARGGGKGPASVARAVHYTGEHRCPVATCRVYCC